MRKLRAPFFEIGPKNYIFGNDVLKLAETAEKAAKEFDVDILFTAPFLDLRAVVDQSERLFVLAPHMDELNPGRGITKILPESVKAAGASGVMLNHAEHPVDFRTLKATVERAKKLELLTVICADSVAEAKAVAELHPTVIIAEPSELIGTGKTSDMNYIRESTETIRQVDPEILVLQAAGVRTVDDVYRNIAAGADATGTTSGVVCAEDPHKTLTDMIRTVREAFDKR